MKNPMRRRPRRIWLGEKIVAQYEDAKVIAEIEAAAARRDAEAAQ